MIDSDHRTMPFTRPFLKPGALKSLERRGYTSTTLERLLSFFKALKSFRSRCCRASKVDITIVALRVLRIQKLPF